MIDRTFLQEFINESNEHLEGIESDLLEIEKQDIGSNAEVVNRVFRAAHSIKGAAGFLQLQNIKILAHTIEAILDRLRSNRLKTSNEIINILLTSFDNLRYLLNNCNSNNELPPNPEILKKLNSLLKENISKNCKDCKPKIKNDLQNTIPEAELKKASELQQFIYELNFDLSTNAAQNYTSPIKIIHDLADAGYIIDSKYEKIKNSKNNDTVFLQVYYRTVIEPNLISEVASIENSRIKILLNPTGMTQNNDPSLIAKQKVEKQLQIIHTQENGPFMEHQNDQQQLNQENKNFKEETIRIRVDVLESLMTRAGELVLSRNQLLDAISRHDLKMIYNAGQRVNLVTAELQDIIMQARLQPIGSLFSRFPRIVRDVAESLHKKVELVIVGRDVEIDKTILEGLNDPLTHMVRNAIDHGIEDIEVRKSLGKSPEGTLNLKARHEAGQIIIDISDDGRGIDVDKVINKAISLNLITEEKAHQLTYNEKLNLILLPGFSTADKITDISGRGVGMDVVKTNLDRLGGKIEISTEKGVGTSFVIKLPLTLAIIPSLIIVVNSQRFAIPQINVAELLCISPKQSKIMIDKVSGFEVLLIRGEIIPLLRLSKVLSIDHSSNNTKIQIESDLKKQYEIQIENPIVKSSTSSDLQIVIISSDLHKYALVVDEMKNTEEIVVKPLGYHLKGLQEYAGATIMGDGSVALILDATGLATKAHINAMHGKINSLKTSEQIHQLTENKFSVLLFKNHLDETCAIPLDMVERVEKISIDQIEIKSGIRSMQYRGKFLPLLNIPECSNTANTPKHLDPVVIVVKIANTEIGVLGSLPVSVSETSNNYDIKTHRQKGIAGSFIHMNETILLLHVEESAIDNKLINNKIHNKEITSNKNILLVEDSNFFRSVVHGYIQEAGYNVIDAHDGKEALKILQQSELKIDCVVTDIEMPELNGYELAIEIRKSKQFKSLPIIALTSLVEQEDKARAHEVGIDEYQIKLDKDNLIDSIEKYFLTTVNGK